MRPPPAAALCSPLPGCLLRKCLSGEAEAGVPVGTPRGNSKNIFPGKANTAICFSCLNYMCYLFLSGLSLLVNGEGTRPHNATKILDIAM